MAKRPCWDSLPVLALEEIFLCLDPKTAFAVFLRLSKQCNVLIKSCYLRSRYLGVIFGTQHDYEPSLQSLKSLFISEKQREAIPLTALMTTGGIDENNMHWWAQNMFTPNHHTAYCSRDNKNNILVAAVLAHLVSDPPKPEFVTASKFLAKLLRGNERLRSIPDILPADSEEDLTGQEVEILFELFRIYSQILVPERPNESEMDETQWIRSQLLVISQALKTIIESNLSFQQVSPHAEDLYYLERPHDQALISSAKALFIAKEVIVSREGNYTCPLETFMVFISEDWIAAESEEFTKFDNLLQADDVVSLGPLNGPETLHRVETESTVYCEFKRTSAQLHPVLWGKFKARQGVEIRVSLQQCVAGKYVYVKLINPENRMAELQDPHTTTNIDCKFVGVMGSVQTFSQD